MFPPTLD